MAKGSFAMWTMVKESYKADPRFVVLRCSRTNESDTCLNYASGLYSGWLNANTTSCYSIKMPGRMPVQSSLPIELKAWASFKRTTLSVAAK